MIHIGPQSQGQQELITSSLAKVRYVHAFELENDVVQSTCRTWYMSRRVTSMFEHPIYHTGNKQACLNILFYHTTTVARARRFRLVEHEKKQSPSHKRKQVPSRHHRTLANSPLQTLLRFRCVISATQATASLYAFPAPRRPTRRQSLGACWPQETPSSALAQLSLLRTRSSSKRATGQLGGRP